MLKTIHKFCYQNMYKRRALQNQVGNTLPVAAAEGISEIVATPDSPVIRESVKRKNLMFDSDDEDEDVVEIQPVLDSYMRFL